MEESNFEKLVLEMLEVFQRAGLNRESAPRDIKMRLEFKELIKDKSLKIKDIKNILAENYCTSIKNVEHVISGLRRGKDAN